MGVDAVVLLRPKNKKLLRKHAHALTPLDDGTFLFNTYMSYGIFEDDPAEARAYLEAELGCPLGDLQDDSRGVLLLPDVVEPRAKTYEGVVREMARVGATLWVPLDDSPDAGVHAADAAAKREAAMADFARKQRSLLSAVEDLMARGVPPEAPEAAALLPQLIELTGPFGPTRPGLKVWSVLVRRKTAIPSSALEGQTNDVLVLPDKSTAIYTTNFEDLDSLAWRLADEFVAWVDQHDDARGIPAFDSDDLEKIRGARSYADAIRRLGKAVTWVTPKGSKEREKERAKKVSALLGALKKKKTAAKKTTKKR